ncbi:sodium:proton antiporter [Oxalobacteraceae bacterium CAVE-383]|nr:sodium:proton antiporter [Oxalobacteraceae bacterium CAVE-383]
MALMASVLERLPVSPAMFYLAVGFALGPSASGLVRIPYAAHAALLTEATRIALLISLFTVGLKLRADLRDRIWLLPLRLGVAGMLVTIGLLTLGGVYLLALPLGAAVLLAAILAPTDPVLASDVQIKDVADRDHFRFGLTGEGGLNDGTAFPFVMLGLALLGAEQARMYAGLDGVLKMAWGVLAGPLCGWLLGWSVGNGVVFLRKRYRLAFGMEEFLAIGLIALSYGLAESIRGFGFLAVFAAGVGMRRIEAAAAGEAGMENGASPSPALAKLAGEAESVAGSDDKAPAYMAATVLDFNQQIEHFAEFMTVLLLGILISHTGFSWEGLGVALVLFGIVRPLSVMIALAGAGTPRLQRHLMGWFGIRGIGSLYYLLFALQYPWRIPLEQRVTAIVMTVLALSVALHGVSSTPLMKMYGRRRQSQPGTGQDKE